MPNIHAMHRRMENFLGYNPDNEIRPDTKGALYSEVQESEWRRRNRERNNQYKFKKDNEGAEIIGINRINFEKMTDKTFYFKSRGKK